MPIKVLIDTWWNVNAFKSSSASLFKAVLIDTWWNVNISNITVDLQTGIVLIDTWWNVNYWQLQMYPRFRLCFNRYMVECE